MNIDINIDSAIFISFLFINLAVGLFCSRGIKSIKEYAIGDRNFSTTTLVSTIVATWVSGSFVFNRLTETYTNGLYYVWTSTGAVFSLLCIGLIFAPRMGRFLGKLSIAEAMGELFGEKIQIISAIASVIAAAGRIAIQFKVTGLLFEYCFNIDGVYGIIIGAFIVTLYSSLGGIKSVTFTDVVQFVTFSTIIPIIAFFMLNEMNSLQGVVDTLSTHPSFNYQEVFDFTKPKSFYYLFLFLYMIAPSFDPPMFQRISMARNVMQVQRSFVISAIVFFFLSVIIMWMAVLILSTNPNLVPKDITKHMLFNYSYIGLKGLTLAGIMAMVMSTADSYINCAAVTLTHDFCKPLKLNLLKNELTSSRYASVLISLFSFVIALNGQSLLKTLIACNSFYMPLVSVPFTLVVFGFNTSAKSVMMGMIAGFSMVVFWYVANFSFIDPIVPGMLANLIFLLGSHYLFKQNGGWEKTSNLSDSEGALSWLKKQNLASLFKNFDLIDLIKKSSPATSGPYIAVGFFCMAMIYATMHSTPREIRLEYPELIKFVTFSSLFAATALLGHPLWLPSWRKKTLISGLIWNLVIFGVLICAAFTFVVITDFSSMQVMIFMINLIIIAGLLKWQLALIVIPFGVFLTLQLLKGYIGADDNMISMSVQLKIAYLLLLVSSSVVIIFRPKQEYQELTEEKNEHLNNRIGSQEKQLREALALRSEFIRNVQHEYHAPITGITGLAQTLSEAYEKLSDSQRRMAIDDILKSSIRLDAFDSNLSSLSILSKAGYELNLEEINFSNLVHDRIKVCRKLYDESKEDREFNINIEEDIIIKGDKKYLTQLLDNLIINAITYCESGKITIELEHFKGMVNFNILDEGIGIPTKELENIFEEFIVSSKTRSSSGNRGVGLALCKRIVEVHSGFIEADSNGVKGATFKVKLPL